MSLTDKFDVVVIGGSFSGLSAALQLIRAKRHVLILDSGTPRNKVAAETHGFLAQDGRNPLELLHEARAQIASYPTVEFLNDEAVDITGSSDNFTISLASSSSVQCRRIILACGIRDILPDKPGFKELWGHGVYHCPYCHGYEIHGKITGIIVYNNITAELATVVRDFTPNVIVFTQGMTHVIPEHLLKRIKAYSTLEETTIERLEISSNGKLAGAKLTDGRVIPLEGLYFRPPFELPEIVLKAKVELTEFGTVKANKPSQETSVPGIYAAGDIQNLLTVVTLAASDGLIAGSSAHRSLISADYP
jgi:thioredoxin reductase